MVIIHFMESTATGSRQRFPPTLDFPQSSFNSKMMTDRGNPLEYYRNPLSQSIKLEAQWTEPVSLTFIVL